MKKLDLALVFQVGVAVDDMDAVLNNWRRWFNINEDSIIRKSTKEIFDRGEFHCANYMGKPCEDYFQKYYRFDLGGLDFEVIEPITRKPGNPWTDFLAQNGGNGIQHLGTKITNRDDLIKNMEEMGIPVMTYSYQGPKTDKLEDRSDCYFYDLRDQIGMVVEAGGAVVGPLSTDPRAGNQAALARLNSYAARPELPEVEPDTRIEKADFDQIFRVTICVSDLEKVMENWRMLFNMDESTIVFEDKEEEGYQYKTCRFDIGGLNFEIVEPVNKEAGNPYSDFLIKTGQNGIHHIGVRLKDREKLAGNMEKLGIEPMAKSDGYLYDTEKELSIVFQAEEM